MPTSAGFTPTIDSRVSSFGDPPATSPTYTSTTNTSSAPSASKPTAVDPVIVRGNNKSAFPPSAVNNGFTGPPLHPRSCVTCRRRKVRCDKRHPCSNCNKASIECVFPNPGRAPRKTRKPPDTELLARLRRLEGVVQGLGKNVDDEGSVEDKKLEAERDVQVLDSTMNSGVELGTCNETTVTTGIRCKRKGGDTGKLEKDFGRLVIEEGRSRYVSNSFWASLSDEVAEMKEILDPISDEEDYPSPDGSGSSQSANHQGFIFSFNSTMVNLRVLHPSSTQIFTMWQVYKENVEPLVKILHIPSMCKVIATAASGLDSLGKGTEALMFAMYLAVVTSLSPKECKDLLSEDKDTALSKYRFATEQALARAGFLNTQDRVVLEAFVLFLICVRRHDDTRFVWTLTGLAIRIAQSLGLQRDGEQFGLNPFETEMRRRLWWQVVLLDIRAAEDHGTDPSITEQSFDTKLPLNVNDEDLDPDAQVAPKEQLGCTEQTFCLIRYEVSTTMRKLTYTPPGGGMCRERGMTYSLEDREKLIEACHKHLEEKYIQYCDMSVPLYWVTANIARLIMSKMWLVVHHPFRRADGGANLPQETKDRLFTTSVEVVEYSRLLETEKTTVKWGWLFRTYVQWHAVAYILSELCTRTKGEMVDRAWSIIDTLFADWGGIIVASKRGMLWRPMRKLMSKARAVRARELEGEARFPKDGTLGPVDARSSNAAGGSVGLAMLDATMDAIGLSPNFTNDASMTMGANPAVDGTQLMAVTSQQQQSQSNEDQINQWIMDDATLLQDPPGDEMLDWTGWDDMVRDFQMEVQQDQGVERGPVLGGMANWW
ncbi:MAG: hypothetical protein M1830_003506 [Pleopsidium flavum]|nr:MAG: hypothetical protein M1830_003506 [Pleopsidium flavum]